MSRRWGKLPFGSTQSGCWTCQAWWILRDGLSTVGDQRRTNFCVRCRGLTRHKISDRCRERSWLRVRRCSHRKRDITAASGSLHRLP